MRFLYVSLLLLIATPILAQKPVFYPSNFVRVLNSNGDTMLNPFAGGMISPIFSNVDLDSDGNEDIFAVDYSDNKLLLFRNLGKGSGKYFYDTRYDHLFPSMYLYAFMKDYDGDGDKDLFAHSDPWSGVGNSTSMSIYENTGAGNTIQLKLVKEKLMYENRTSTEELVLANLEIPEISDIDNDGDLDILYIQENDFKIRYLKNMSQELYGHYDSLVYWLWDECWGAINEETTSVIKLGLICDTTKIKRRTKKHAGSALLAIDNDGDGDKDLVIADAGKSTIYYLENGRIVGSTEKSKNDTVTKAIEYWPSSKKLDIRTLPHGSFIDVDNDGIDDLVFAPMEPEQAASDNNMWYYRNEPNTTTGAPDLTLMEQNFLLGTMIDFGTNSKPFFIDYDMDGKVDMLMNVEFRTATGVEDTRQIYFKNITSNGRTKFKLTSSVLPGFFSSSDVLFLNTAFPTDMDGDGTIDLMVGLTSGMLSFYKGSKGSQTLKFSIQTRPQEIEDSQIQDIHLGQAVSPVAIDLTSDGKKDLLIGRADGKISYYKNITGSGSLTFEKVTDNYGSIQISGHAYLNLADVTGNGTADLAVGSGKGELLVYPDVSDSPPSNWQPYTDIIYDFGLKTSTTKFLGADLVPALANLDSDNIPDLVIGNKRGGLYFFGSVNNGPDDIPNVSIPEEIYASHDFNLYPNPATSVLHIAYRGTNVTGKASKVRILDLMGREIKNASLELSKGGSTSISTDGMQAGLYFVTINNMAGNTLYSSKVLIK